MDEDPALDIDIAVEAPAWEALEDAEAFVLKVLGAAAKAENISGQISVLLCDDAAIQALNKQFRGKDAPTDVLSFPAWPAAAPGFLGDVALAFEASAAAARAQSKSLQAHTAHLLVHGFLHLLDYDHQDDSAAEIMEARERGILAELGIADPYIVPGEGLTE